MMLMVVAVLVSRLIAPVARSSVPEASAPSLLTAQTLTGDVVSTGAAPGQPVCEHLMPFGTSPGSPPIVHVPVTLPQPLSAYCVREPAPFAASGLVESTAVPPPPN